jgi:7,8-dihydroneopterin aldolase/epimerase/oxygenase
MDHLRLQNMTFYGPHGVHPHERELGRTISVDVDLSLDTRVAGETDDLDAALDYSRVYGLVRDTQAAHPYKLLEAIAEAIAKRLLQEFPGVVELTVRVRKREPSVGGWLDFAEVEITRGRN